MEVNKNTWRHTACNPQHTIADVQNKRF
jgi:hypothetical protein